MFYFLISLWSDHVKFWGWCCREALILLDVVLWELLSGFIYETLFEVRRFVMFALGLLSSLSLVSLSVWGIARVPSVLVVSRRLGREFMTAVAGVG